MGRGTARRLLAALGSPRRCFTASPEALKAVVSARDAQALATPPDSLSDQVEQTWAWLREPDLVPARARFADAGRCPLSRSVVADGRPAHVVVRARPAGFVVKALRGDGGQSPDRAGARQRPGVCPRAQRGRRDGGVWFGLGVDGAAHEGALSALASLADAPDADARGSTIAVVGTGWTVSTPASTLSWRIASPAKG